MSVFYYKFFVCVISGGFYNQHLNEGKWIKSQYSYLSVSVSKMK